MGLRSPKNHRLDMLHHAPTPIGRPPGAISPPLCIYHGNCIDGFASAWVVSRAHEGQEINYLAGIYGNAPPDVSGRDVILVDFCYPRDELLDMARQAHSILILDHHKSAQAELINLPEHVTTRFDMSRCGATLAWAHYFGHTPQPDLLAYIEDWDLQRFALPSTREITAAAGSYPYLLRVWDWLFSRDIDLLAKEGEPIVRQRDMDVREMLQTMVYRGEIDGYDVPMLNASPKLVADAGHELCRNEPFSVCYYDTATHRVYSLRSDPHGVDVSYIAMQFGGGGHEHAAGFRLLREHAARLSAKPATPIFRLPSAPVKGRVLTQAQAG